jgi:hypothetical protein
MAAQGAVPAIAPDRHHAATTTLQFSPDKAIVEFALVRPAPGHGVDRCMPLLGATVAVGCPSKAPAPYPRAHPRPILRQYDVKRDDYECCPVGYVAVAEEVGADRGGRGDLAGGGVGGRAQSGVPSSGGVVGKGEAGPPWDATPRSGLGNSLAHTCASTATLAPRPTPNLPARPRTARPQEFGAAETAVSPAAVVRSPPPRPRPPPTRPPPAIIVASDSPPPALRAGKKGKNVTRKGKAKPPPRRISPPPPGRFYPRPRPAGRRSLESIAQLPGVVAPCGDGGERMVHLVLQGPAAAAGAGVDAVCDQVRVGGGGAPAHALQQAEPASLAPTGSTHTHTRVP